MEVSNRRGQLWAIGFAVTLLPGLASAIEFTIPFKEDGIKAVLNNSITAGVQVRTQAQAADLIGKGDLNPSACGRQGQNGNVITSAAGDPLYQSCQGLFLQQTAPARRLVAVPGAASMNTDDGDLNYKKGDITQAPIKLTQDLSITYSDYGFFARTLAFYDPVNDNFTEFHPNVITPQNVLQVGNLDQGGNNALKGSSKPCGTRSTDPTCSIVYGAGAPIYSKRTDKETLRQIGAGVQLLDLYAYGKLPIGSKELTFKIGRQTINWGESTLLVINSLNQAQPVNANNVYRTGFAVEEVFNPQASISLSGQIVEGLTLEGFYQFQWQPVEIPPSGAYLSNIDVGTPNINKSINLSFGGAPDDPSAVGNLQDNPLATLTNTTLHGTRLPDLEPRRFGLTGQYGFQLKYFADWLNNGTELGLYFMNYHSKLPLASVFSIPNACSKNATNPATFLAACPDVPLTHTKTDPGHPENATSSIVNFDKFDFMLEYPENIHLIGLSFNTTAGPFSLQGEVAYRPNLPLQISTPDLAFAAFGPSLTNCHLAPGTPLPGGGTQGTCTNIAMNRATGVSGTGVGPNGEQNFVYQGGSNARDYGANIAYQDYIDLAAGNLPGSGRSFPNFVIPYRGGVLGLNAPTDYTKPLDKRNPGYIQGYERMGVFEFDFGATQVLGATDKISTLFGADQVILLFEAGATLIPDLPKLDQLQISGPGAYYHASAGADGSGADGSKQACSTNAACVIGEDGGRFNPHQEDLHRFATKFSWGYRVISLIRYESVFPGISFQPMVILEHDVDGVAPDPAGNFVRDRKAATINIEMRYKSAFSITPGYKWFTGGGAANLFHDRDYAQVYLKYLF
jgi:hypothetical protein